MEILDKVYTLYERQTLIHIPRAVVVTDYVFNQIASMTNPKLSSPGYP